MTIEKEKIGCLSFVFPFLRQLQKKAILEELPYRLRDDFLSPAEFSFYKVLLPLVGTKLTIQSKVRLADVFFVARPNKNMTYFSRIAQKHLDFLVCDSITMKPMFAIELDDTSHKDNNREKRDIFIDNICKVAGLPLLRFPVKRSYDSEEIAIQIAPFIKEKGMTSFIKEQEVNKQVNSVPICPKCGIPSR